MKKTVFYPVVTQLKSVHRDEFPIGFFESESEAWAFLDDVDFSDDRYSWAVRCMDIDLLDGESLKQAFVRYDRDYFHVYPDRIMRLLSDI